MTDGQVFLCVALILVVLGLPGILEAIMAYQDAKDRSRRERWEDRHR